MIAPRRRQCQLILAAVLVAVGLAAEEVALLPGGTAEVVRLEADGVAVAMIPALGGKLISITGPDGYEWLSRSPRPYRARAGLKTYGDTEFDGADEIFPSMEACDGIPPHGELWRLPWTRVAGPGLTYALDGQVRPYRFQRSIAIDHGAIVLSYRIDNPGPEALPFFYLFHPLFSIAEPLELELPPAQPMRLNYSQHHFLGQAGSTVPWSALTATSFASATASRSALRFWGIGTVAPALPAKLRRPGGAALVLSWDSTVLPYLTLWCSEASPFVDNLAHLALEPCTSASNKLSDAIRDGVARVLPAGGHLAWQTRIAFEPRR